MWYVLDRMPEAIQRLLFEYGFSFAITDFGDYLEKKRIKFWDNNGDLRIPVCDEALKACFEDKFKIELHGDKVFDLEINNNNIAFASYVELVKKHCGMNEKAIKV